MQTLIEFTCECGAPIGVNPDSARQWPSLQRLCEACQDVRDVKIRTSLEESAVNQLGNSWSIICPPLYRATDRTRLPKAGLAAVNAWLEGPATRGISFSGAPGTSKTRLMFEALRVLHFEGSRVDAISATAFAKLCVSAMMGSESEKAKAGERMMCVRNCGFLLLDDVGKEKFTERAEVELYDLLEHRTSRFLVTLWTANCNAKQLAARLSSENGGSIIRRLSEFSENHAL